MRCENFFDSIDQEILIKLIKKKVNDAEVIWLLQTIISSFDKGLPLGNVVSQLFSNIYLNELDQFVKHTLKIKYYIRYCDDFVIIEDIGKFKKQITQIDDFLKNNLKLLLHPNKVIIKKYHQGVDFLGYVNFPHHTILRTKTKTRIFKKIKFKIKELKEGKIPKESFGKTLQSYFGVLGHCNSHALKGEILKLL